MAYSIEQRDEQLRGTAAAIRYRITFRRAAQHLARITMEIDAPGDETVLVMPSWIPGSYKVRDFVAHQGDLIVSDGGGQALEHEWIAKNRLRITSAGAEKIVAEYNYYANERSVRTSHVNRFHAFINPANCLMYVEGRTDEIHHVSLEHPWRQVSTALSPVELGTWGALNYDILADSPIEIGDHFVATFERHGALHEIAITGRGDFDSAWIAEQTKTIVDRALEMWGPLPYDRYVFIIQLLPGQYGGLEHARSSVNMFDALVFTDKEKTVKLLTLLCHEYFHLWNVKRIRPRELGPFDYDTENYTRMLWLAEGVTSYYDDLMAYRCGFHSRDEYLKTLSKEHLGKLLDVPGRQAMSIKDSSYLSWVKLYIPTADSTNRFPSYYLKGGVIFLLLDMWIIERTNGAKSLDDGMRALMDHYRANPAVGVTEEEFVRIVSDAAGVEIGETLRSWLNDTEELPIVEILDGMGLEWRRKERERSSRFGADLEYQTSAPEPRTGVQLEDAKNGPRVARLWRESAAEQAGIGAGDEIVALDGVRVPDVKTWDALLRGARDANSVRITAASEGILYETDLRLEPKETYELVEKSEKTEEEKKRLNRWLAR